MWQRNRNHLANASAFSCFNPHWAAVKTCKDFAIRILQHENVGKCGVSQSPVPQEGFELPGRAEHDFAAITAGAPLNPAGHRVKVTDLTFS
jgi:hypothetical protein